MTSAAIWSKLAPKSSPGSRAECWPARGQRSLPTTTQRQRRSNRHLAYLTRHYSVIPLGDLVAAMEAGDLARLPPRSLVVTLDDGHARNASLGETFRRYGVRPTIYVCSQIVGTVRHYWFTAVENREAQALKLLPNTERLRILEERAGFSPTRDYSASERQALTLEELACAMAWADIGAHSRSHPILTSCSDDVLEEEVAGSRRDLEAIIGGPCLHFAYPNGTYADREVDLVKGAGFASARTIDFGWNEAGTDRFRLKSVSVTGDASISVLLAQLSGAPARLNSLKSRLRR